jgi:hypothetical protein
MMWRIPLLILRFAGVSRELKVEVVTVMVIMLRKKNIGVVISSLAGLTSESLTIIPTEGLLIIISQGWQTLW